MNSSIESENANELYTCYNTLAARMTSSVLFQLLLPRINSGQPHPPQFPTIAILSSPYLSPIGFAISTILLISL
jgi:hypothetical protein